MSPPEAVLDIHGYVACPFAWRVRLVAAEKGLWAEWLPCDVDAPDPRAISHNPQEHSPLLYHDGFTLLESVVIAQYVDEAFPGRGLTPSDPRRRAELRLLSTRLEATDVHMEHSRPEARRRSAAALQLLEEELGEQPFLHGEAPGLTDLLLWPFLANLRVRGLVPEATHPRAIAYFARARARPSFGATLPPWAAATRGERPFA